MKSPSARLQLLTVGSGKIVGMKRAKKFGHRYPWDRWFAGKKFLLTRGEDFSGMVHGMAQMVRNVASKRKIAVEVYILRGDRVLVKVCNGVGNAAS